MKIVETRGVSSVLEKTRAQNPTVMRIDVLDFDHTVEELAERGVQVQVQPFDWGTRP